MSAARRPRAFGLVPHPNRSSATELTKHAAARLTEQGAEVRVPGPDADGAGLGHLAVELDDFATGLDIVISLGGDGTMLRAVDLAYEAGVPVLGVNLGQLGYLTEVEPHDFESALDRLVAGEYEVAERMMLQVDVESAGPARGRWFALNEAVLEKVHTGRLVRLDVDVNGVPWTPYAADGVIIATPTGSTAYSFSARGPIVSPRHRCLLLTPVSPHMLFDRSLVLDAEESLCFRVSDDRSVVLTADGRELGELAAGDSVTCTGGSAPARIVTFRPRDFHQILKAKFGLPDR
ncbi:MAG TPA: NAD(+)/NADH kinase [Acidimicrobiia bacterium]|nr:NAD(+)/NADH kinase [Acidimicrobiia bacterium]